MDPEEGRVVDLGLVERAHVVLLIPFVLVTWFAVRMDDAGHYIEACHGCRS